ncbi:hypothetical protein FQN57_004025 [Myotisia sp. PD_48]|nr:hypothetical protein FQN57_004025 [Myotisia sp. PD_48]
MVALTIDDGPSEFTEEILQILKANDVSATFFIIGSHITPEREGVLQDLIRNKCELANHAMHDEPSWRLSDSDLIDQIQSAQTLITDAYIAANSTPSPLTGSLGGPDQLPTPKYYFRPGSGVFTTRMRKVLSLLGYKLVMGSIYPHDAYISSWRINLWHILSLLAPGGIIICHDGRSWTIPMLKRLLPELKRRGYRVVTLSELLDQAQT